jgi:hypothetical protein
MVGNRLRESRRVLIVSMMRSSFLIRRLVLLPRKIRVVLPPRIVGLKIWSIRLLLIIIEVFTCSIGYSKNTSIDGQFYAEGIGLA